MSAAQFTVRSDGERWGVVNRAGDAELGNWMIARCWSKQHATLIADALNAQSAKEAGDAATLEAAANAPEWRNVEGAKASPICLIGRMGDYVVVTRQERPHPKPFCLLAATWDALVRVEAP